MSAKPTACLAHADQGRAQAPPPLAWWGITESELTADCDTREHAAAAHEAALAVMRERQPSVAVRVAASGTTSVLAMA